MLVDQRQIYAALYALETTTTGHGHRGLESYKLDGPSSHFHPAGNDGDGRVSRLAADDERRVARHRRAARAPRPRSRGRDRAVGRGQHLVEAL